MKLTKVAPLVWQDETGCAHDMQELLELGYHFIDGEPVMPIPIPVVLASAEDGAKQVRFRCETDEDEVADHGGILVGSLLICGDCGGVWDLEDGDADVVVLEVYEDWVDISDVITG